MVFYWLHKGKFWEITQIGPVRYRLRSENWQFSQVLTNKVKNIINNRQPALCIKLKCNFQAKDRTNGSLIFAFVSLWCLDWKKLTKFVKKFNIIAGMHDSSHIRTQVWEPRSFINFMIAIKLVMVKTREFNPTGLANPFGKL